MLRYLDSIGVLLPGQSYPLPRVYWWLAYCDQLTLQHALETSSQIVADIVAGVRSCTELRLLSLRITLWSPGTIFKLVHTKTEDPASTKSKKL